MKNLFKIMVLGLFISLLSVSCGSGSDNKDKKEADSTSVNLPGKEQKKREPLSGCD